MLVLPELDARKGVKAGVSIRWCLMSAPSLGYESNTILAKAAIAQTQLVEAIAQFVAIRFLCAITLAGAAEEVLGKLLLRKSELPVIRESLQTIHDICEKTGLTVVAGKSDKEIIDEWNATRNALKHLVAPEEEFITINLCDEAYWMIKRALSNAHKLQIPIENEQDFENWVVINVNT